jgi:ribosomal protein L24
MDKKPGRMFLYVWSESTNPHECKFGERWVQPSETPEDSVRARVRDSLGVRKDLLNTGIVSIDHIWDVTSYATRVGRCQQHARMDDYVRGFVGHRKGTTGEIHTISSLELILKVNQHLASVNQELPSAGLSTMQYRMCLQTLEAYEQGKQVVLAELCARFGKTIYSGAVARELESPLVIVASYVKTVFASFAKDLTSFQQWSHYQHVDTQKDGWQEQVTQALKSKKPVICYLSMCSGSQREARIKWLCQKRVERLLVVDEADYGSYRPGQAELLKKHIGKRDRVLIMTGTNADRASKLWKIDTMLSVTYPELLVQKHAVQQGTTGNA